MSSDKTTVDTSKGGVPADEVLPPAVEVIDPRLLVREQGFRGYITEFKRRVKGGELGSMPVIAALIIIFVVFQLANDRFLSANNISNIGYYLAGAGMLSIGLVFVLLLGEIDLSVASVSGLAAAIFAVFTTTHGMNMWLAVLLTIVIGVAIGAIHGFFLAKIGVPAFVVTLAGFLGWNGLMLWLLRKTGSISIADTGPIHIVDQTSFFMNSSIAGAYILATVGVAAMLLSSLADQARRRKAGVPFRPTSEILLRTVLLAIVSYALAIVLNNSNGVPNALVLFLVVLVICDYVVRRTTFGRKVFAVGGSIEASSRAGISVPGIRIAVFAIAGGFAALGGLFIAGQIQTANTQAGSGNLLMLAIAAAVIGGTSLFGGRGNVWSALIGGLVIQSIQTGLDLLNMDVSIQYMITGGVLLAAVVIDSVSRRTQRTSGRA
ncbi:D-xylose transport system permease protein [Actinacidiphila yanglinensis]|uniref:Xylose transport system permease protein XylH n=1 Tax=Actinacidiphila yanglinensis TaxID=310779 RepID=A0A1H5XA20_9ACTN|nr:D-xylose transport system permease protein [Actinacidiphila yanglinensis]